MPEPDPEFLYFSDDQRRMAVSEIVLYRHSGVDEDGANQYRIVGTTPSEDVANKFLETNAHGDEYQPVVPLMVYDALYESMVEIGIRDPYSFIQSIDLINKWGYDWMRAQKYPGLKVPCTEKQADYIGSLAEEHPEAAQELEMVINCFESGEGAWIGLEACSKGAAMFVINKLKFFRERPDDQKTG